MRLVLVGLFLLSALSSFGQVQPWFGNFPAAGLGTTSLTTEELLADIKWRELKRYCDTASDHYATEVREDGLEKFTYLKRGASASFEIISYQGYVLEFKAENPDSEKATSSSYFDKRIWLQYVDSMLPGLDGTDRIGIGEAVVVLKAYYQLLGVGTRNEYGWICEYATMGRPTGRRLATIHLLEQGRIDLLKRVLHFPNIQSQLYAADALLFEDFRTKKLIAIQQEKIKEGLRQVDSITNASRLDRKAIERIRAQIEFDENLMRSQKVRLLSSEDWEAIHKLRDSNKSVLVCGNNGSYKVYGTSTAEILSEESIANIPKQYEMLKRLNYFR